MDDLAMITLKLSLFASAGGVCTDQTLVHCLLPDQEADEPLASDFTDKLPDVYSSEAPATAATK